MKNTMHLDAFQTAMGRKHTDFSLGAMKHTEQMDFPNLQAFVECRRRRISLSTSTGQDGQRDPRRGRRAGIPPLRPPGKAFILTAQKRFLHVGGAGCKQHNTQGTIHK